MKQFPNSIPTDRGYRKRHSRSRVWLAILLLAPLTACSKNSLPPVFTENRTKQIEAFHPPLPAPIGRPVKVNVEVLTPDTTKALNEEVEAGEIQPYVYFGFSHQDYLTMAQWQQDVLRYVRQLGEVVSYYPPDKDIGKGQ